MWKYLTLSWPVVGASVAFTAAVLGGYTYYVHAVVLPAQVLAEQKADLAVQLREAAVQRDVEAAGNAILNTMAMMQASQALTPMAIPEESSDSTLAATYVEPAPVGQPAFLPPAPAPAMGYFATVAANPPPQQFYYPPSVPASMAVPVAAPGVVTVMYAPPEPLVETVPQVLTNGSYWAPGYWNYNQGRFNWTKGQVKPTPAAYISSSSVYVPTEWVVQNGAYTLIPGHWVNPAPNSIPSNTLPGAAPGVQVTVAATNRSGTPRSPNRAGGGG